MNFKKIFIRHYDLLIGAVFFICYKFYFVHLLFRERYVPPEPDDVYSYLFYSKKLFEISSFEQFRSLLYSVWLNFLGILSGSFENAFILNFYIGTVFLFLTLYIFLSKLEKNKLRRSILLFSLALYSGSGAYHGFYWAGPSFYQVLFFFLIAINILDLKIYLPRIIILSALFIFIHPSSIFVLLTFPILALILLARKEIFQKQIKVSLLYFVFGLMFYLTYVLLSINLPKHQVFVSPNDILTMLKGFLEGRFVFVSGPIINREYFHFIFLNPITVIGFIICLIFTQRLKGLQFLSLYFAVLGLVIISAVIPFGYRSLEFLWPLTFIVFGYGIIGIHSTVLKYSSQSALVVLVGILGLFGLTATSLNLAWTNSVNAKKNYAWDRSCPSKLANLKPSQPVVFTSWDSFYGFQLYGLPSSRIKIFTKDYIIKPDEFLVISDPAYDFSRTQTLSPIQRLLTQSLTRNKQYPSNNITNYYWYDLGDTNQEKVNGKPLLDCGYFKVFQVE